MPDPLPDVFDYVPRKKRDVPFTKNTATEKKKDVPASTKITGTSKGKIQFDTSLHEKAK